MHFADNDDAAARVGKCLLDGGVALIPTDTVYGLAVHPSCDRAVARLFEMKGRPNTINLPIMISSVTDITDIGARLNYSSRKLIESSYFPGPLTIALGVVSDKLPSWLAGRDEVALRMPDDQWLLSVLQGTGPLLVTSANAHMHETKESVSDILGSLGQEPDIIVDGGVRSTVSSTLVNCHLDPPVVERVGAISLREIEEILQ
jgi:L-threonylcarbamoyladenylate synthase